MGTYKLMDNDTRKDTESFKQIRSIASAEHSDSMQIKKAKYIHQDCNTQRATLLHIHGTNLITDESKREQDQTITGSIEKSVEGGVGETVLK